MPKTMIVEKFEFNNSRKMKKYFQIRLKTRRSFSLRYCIKKIALKKNVLMPQTFYLSILNIKIFFLNWC